MDDPAADSGGHHVYSFGCLFGGGRNIEVAAGCFGREDELIFKLTMH